MGLAASQVRFLTLTSRKADLEYNIAIDSMEKMALSREQSNLSKEYYSKLKAQKICYFANNQYNKITYQYLMGSGYNECQNFHNKNRISKDNASTILTDYKGLVVLNNTCAQVIRDVMGGAVGIDSAGRGKPFSLSDENLAKMICAVAYNSGASNNLEKVKSFIENGTYKTEGDFATQKTLTGESTGEKTKTYSTTDSDLCSVIAFYLPIFKAAATNGFTTEYNNEINTNSDYVSDALVSGTFCLAQVGKDAHDNFTGEYEPNTSLTYFITNGTVQERNDSDAREEVTAWYNAEKERISEKEDFLDIELKDFSTELVAINTEMQAVKTLIDDAIQSVFDWGSA